MFTGSRARWGGASRRVWGGSCPLGTNGWGARPGGAEGRPTGAPTIGRAHPQAIVFARLFNIWLQHDPDAAEILPGMIEQRKRLNLIKSQTPVLPSRPGVIPIVAVQRGLSPGLPDRGVPVPRHLHHKSIDRGA